jgi:Zn-dependent peptidase ImmA (M78 family)/transcriptional regulator with XRE-family HTH domain
VTCMLRWMESALGARIRTLREQAGLQSQELAAQLGIDPSAMSNIERGKRSVKTKELVRIAEILSVSPLSLIDEDSLPARMPVAPRCDGDAVSKGDAYSRLVALSELHVVLSDAGLTKPNQLDAAPPLRPGGWKARAEALAEWATNYLNVAATADDRFAGLADAIEDRLGVDVLVERYEGDALSGAAITDRTFPLIFVNARHSTPRSLFTLAHELGHLLIGHDGSITLDEELVGDTLEERQANAFAAAFLMPESEVDQRINEYGRGADSLARMVYDFGVSFESLVFRLHNIHQIDAEGRDRLREIGWRGLLSLIENSDLQDRLGPEVSMRLITRLGEFPAHRPPIWLATRCFAAHRRGIVSVRPLAGLLHIDPDILLDHIESLDEGSAQVLERAEEPPRGEQLSDDELFAGSPVS